MSTVKKTNPLKKIRKIYNAIDELAEMESNDAGALDETSSGSVVVLKVSL